MPDLLNSAISALIGALVAGSITLYLTGRKTFLDRKNELRSHLLEQRLKLEFHQESKNPITMEELKKTYISYHSLKAISGPLFSRQLEKEWNNYRGNADPGFTPFGSYTVIELSPTVTSGNTKKFTTGEMRTKVNAFLDFLDHDFPRYDYSTL